MMHQIMRVRAPWIKACHMVDNRFYAIPNFEALILGGTAYQGDWNAEVSEQARVPSFAAECQTIPGRHTRRT